MRHHSGAMVVTVMVVLAALVAGDGRRADAAVEVEAQLLEQLAADGQADFFVWLERRPDLAPAASLGSKAAKGRFVLDELRRTAGESQGGLRALLEQRQAGFTAYYIANKVLVRGGSRALLDEIAARPEVARITANHAVQLLDATAGRGLAREPRGVEANISFIGAPAVWATGFSGGSVVVAVNDTGVDAAHPALASHYRGCLDPPTCQVVDHDYNWWDATGTYPAAPNDGYGHGTLCTGIAVGDDGGSNQIGVAPGALVIHCKMLSDGGATTDAEATECFQWDLAPWDLGSANPDPALAPDVVSISWGYWGGDAAQFRDEIQALNAAGIAVVAAAGNEGPTCATLRSPGDYPEVLAVGAVDSSAAYPGTLLAFSSRGPSDLEPSPPDYFPGVMAPGQSIRSSVPGGAYESWSGTNMAAPHVAGVVALMWSACPELHGAVARTIDLIRAAAAPLGGTTGSSCGGDYSTGPNDDWGYGTVDAELAVRQAMLWCESFSIFADGFETGDTSAWVSR